MDIMTDIYKLKYALYRLLSNNNISELTKLNNIANDCKDKLKISEKEKNDFLNTDFLNDIFLLFNDNKNYSAESTNIFINICYNLFGSNFIFKFMEVLYNILTEENSIKNIIVTNIVECVSKKQLKINFFDDYNILILLQLFKNFKCKSFTLEFDKNMTTLIKLDSNLFFIDLYRTSIYSKHAQISFKILLFNKFNTYDDYTKIDINKLTNSSFNIKEYIDIQIKYNNKRCNNIYSYTFLHYYIYALHSCTDDYKPLNIFDDYILNLYLIEFIILDLDNKDSLFIYYSNNKSNDVIYKLLSNLLNFISGNSNLFIFYKEMFPLINDITKTQQCNNQLKKYFIDAFINSNIMNTVEFIDYLS